MRLRGIAAAPGQAYAPAWRWGEPRIHDSGVDLSGEAGINRLQVATQ